MIPGMWSHEGKYFSCSFIRDTNTCNNLMNSENFGYDLADALADFQTKLRCKVILDNGSN